MLKCNPREEGAKFFPSSCRVQPFCADRPAVCLRFRPAHGHILLCAAWRFSCTCKMQMQMQMQMHMQYADAMPPCACTTLDPNPFPLASPPLGPAFLLTFFSLFCFFLFVFLTPPTT